MNKFFKRFSWKSKGRNAKMSFLGLFLMFTLSMISGLESQAQTTQAVSMNPAPGGKSWVNSNVAVQTVQSEIQLLTAQLNQLIQSGANNTVIGKKDTQLQFYKAILELLNTGQHVSWAIQDAYILVGGAATSDAGGQHPFMSLSELQSMRDVAISKLTF